MTKDIDPFEVLESKTASTQEKKDAFRKLARQHHPDLNGGKGDPAEFARASEAYKKATEKETAPNNAAGPSNRPASDPIKDILDGLFKDFSKPGGLFGPNPFVGKGWHRPFGFGAFSAPQGRDYSDLKKPTAAAPQQQPKPKPAAAPPAQEVFTADSFGRFIRVLDLKFDKMTPDERTTHGDEALAGMDKDNSIVTSAVGVYLGFFVINYPDEEKPFEILAKAVDINPKAIDDHAFICFVNRFDEFAPEIAQSEKGVDHCCQVVEMMAKTDASLLTDKLMPLIEKIAVGVSTNPANTSAAQNMLKAIKGLREAPDSAGPSRQEVPKSPSTGQHFRA